MVERRGQLPPHRLGAGGDPGPGSRGLQGLNVDAGVAEGAGVGGVGSRGVEVVGVLAAVVDQLRQQDAVALGGLGPSLDLLAQRGKLLAGFGVTSLGQGGPGPLETLKRRRPAGRVLGVLDRVIAQQRRLLQGQRRPRRRRLALLDPVGLIPGRRRS